MVDPLWIHGGSTWTRGLAITGRVKVLISGYGMTTPRTTLGKVLTMLYGFLGCASCILFFNLFLERIVTLFAYCIRYFRQTKEKYFSKTSHNSGTRVSGKSGSDDFDSELSSTVDNNLHWRPSVYAVFCLLFALCLAHMCSAAVLYSNVENWSVA